MKYKDTAAVICQGILAVFLVSMLVVSTSAKAQGNPGTDSFYFPQYIPETGRYVLCWTDKHGHGNCQDVGQVFEMIRQFQNQVNQAPAAQEEGAV